MNWFWELLKILGVFLMLCILGAMIVAHYLDKEIGWIY